MTLVQGRAARCQGTTGERDESLWSRVKGTVPGTHLLVVVTTLVAGALLHEGEQVVRGQPELPQEPAMPRMTTASKELHSVVGLAQDQVLGGGHAGVIGLHQGLGVEGRGIGVSKVPAHLLQQQIQGSLGHRPQGGRIQVQVHLHNTSGLERHHTRQSSSFCIL